MASVFSLLPNEVMYEIANQLVYRNRKFRLVSRRWEMMTYETFLYNAQALAVKRNGSALFDTKGGHARLVSKLLAVYLIKGSAYRLIIMRDSIDTAKCYYKPEIGMFLINTKKGIQKSTQRKKKTLSNFLVYLQECIERYKCDIGEYRYNNSITIELNKEYSKDYHVFTMSMKNIDVNPSKSTNVEVKIIGLLLFLNRFLFGSIRGHRDESEILRPILDKILELDSLMFKRDPLIKNIKL